jgi:hypothetical protein
MIVNTARMTGMRRPGATIAVMFGMPSTAMSELDSSDGDKQPEHEDGDIATEAIVSIIHHLHKAGPSAVRDLRAFTSALEAMCEAHMSKDPHGFEDAAGDAVNALHDLISEE